MSSPNKSSQTPGMIEFVVIISMIMSLVALSIDAMLPALEEIGKDLAVKNPNDVQYIISVLFLGMALGQIIFGPLSDVKGRKPAIFLGFSIFLTGCVISVFAQSFELMLFGRLLQGFGASSPRIVTVALVRDCYSGRAMARVMSFSMSIFILVPILAPALGQWVMQFSGWRGIFVSFILLTVVVFVWFGFRLGETLPVENRQSFSMVEIGRNLLIILKNKLVLGYTLCAFFVRVCFCCLSQSFAKNTSNSIWFRNRFPALFWNSCKFNWSRFFGQCKPGNALWNASSVKDCYVLCVRIVVLILYNFL